MPQVRGLPGWHSEVKAAISGKTEELERLAIEMYARGLSMRDIEAAFTDASGRCVLSRTAASRVAEQLWTDYQAFATRSLAEIPIVYLFVDGVAERLHLGQPREAILVAWGIAEDGTKQVLGLLPGTKEDTASCRDFLRDLKARRLPDPVAVITDGAPGLIRAERAVLKLMFAAILRASKSWLGIGINDFERRHLHILREELEQQFHHQNTVAFKPASRSKNYSNQGT